MSNNNNCSNNNNNSRLVTQELQQQQNPQVPSVEDNKSLDKLDDKRTSYSCFVYCEQGLPLLEKQNHSKRLQNLRKELNFIKETEWIYDSVE